MQKWICLGLKHTTIRLEHCGRKASLITLDILFQWLGVESNYTNSSEEKIFWRWTTPNFNIGICVQGLVSGMWGFFFPHLKLLALQWNMHQASAFIGSVFRNCWFTKLCRPSLGCTHCRSLVLFHFSLTDVLDHHSWVTASLTLYRGMKTLYRSCPNWTHKHKTKSSKRKQITLSEVDCL